jgi:ankyrin repeat protein
VAAGNGHETLVKLLLDIDNDDVNAKDSGGRAPFCEVAYQGFDAVVGLLLQRGRADVKERDSYRPGKIETTYFATPLL